MVQKHCNNVWSLFNFAIPALLHPCTLPHMHAGTHTWWALSAVYLKRHTRKIEWRNAPVCFVHSDSLSSLHQLFNLCDPIILPCNLWKQSFRESVFWCLIKLNISNNMYCKSDAHHWEIHTHHINVYTYTNINIWILFGLKCTE